MGSKGKYKKEVQQARHLGKTFVKFSFISQLFFTFSFHCHCQRLVSRHYGFKSIFEGMLHGRLNALLVDAGLDKVINLLHAFITCAFKESKDLKIQVQTQVNFRIYGSRGVKKEMPQQRNPRAGFAEAASEEAGFAETSNQAGQVETSTKAGLAEASSEEAPEKIGYQSSPADDVTSWKVADAKEGDQGGEETGDEEETVEEKLAKSPSEQSRPLPFVDETAEEE